MTDRQSSPDPYRPNKANPDQERTKFTRGKIHPEAVDWYGLRSFWGHVQHFLASGMATEDIDSRDWMHPDEPDKLVRRVLREIGGTPLTRNRDLPLVDQLGRDLWIDFLADCGDDSSVSTAVARMLFRDYEVPDPENPGQYILAPRGDILLFGGDTAYPVATASQIQDRLVVPFNRVLMRIRDGKKRALMGIPGNHDWYDGLDGFARMFRRKMGPIESEQLDILQPTIDEAGESRLDHVVEWAEKFVVRGTISKRKALVLDGYSPVQHASYFILPLTNTLHLFGVDRQLRNVDFRQRRYFASWREKYPQALNLVVMHDPVKAFLRPNEIGESTVRSLELELETRPHLILTGDMHHYERWQSGASTHVVAGGGGAFLHPAPINRQTEESPDVEWPGPKASIALLPTVPFRLLFGRAGFIPHMVVGVLFATIVIGAAGYSPSLLVMAGASIAAGLASGVPFSLTGGTRYSRIIPVWILGLLTGLLTGALSFAGGYATMRLAEIAGTPFQIHYLSLVIVGLSLIIGPFCFGVYLMLLTRWGIEHTQAFTVLAHPGYRHFVRLRIRQSGKIDVWTLGQVDPLGHKEPVVLIDQFSWSDAAKEYQSTD